MHPLNNTLAGLAKFCAILAGVLLTVITLMTCVSLIGRNTTGWTIAGDFELTGVAAGAAIAPLFTLVPSQAWATSLLTFSPPMPAVKHKISWTDLALWLSAS
jgi:hypothetical protein